MEKQEEQRLSSTMLQGARASTKSILVLGEQLTDRWHLGHFSRQNPESPDTQVFVVEKSMETPGGAASFAASLSAFNPRMTTVFSDIPAATKERWALSRSGQIVFRADRDLSLSADSGQLSIENICVECRAHDIIVLDDYGKGFFCWELLSALQQTNALDKRTVVFSPHVNTCRSVGEISSLLRFDRWIWVMNELESLTLKESPQLSVVTGGDGHVLVKERGEKSIIELPENAPCPVHTCAVGDVFLAGFCAALLDKPRTLADCAWFAMQCAQRSLASNRLGTHYLLPEDLA